MLSVVSFFERDMVRRLIRQLGEIAARIAGLAAQRKFDEALLVVRQTEQELLGPLTDTLDTLDTPTVCLLLGSEDKVGAWAVLLSERAKLFQAQDKLDEARRVAVRAVELFQVLERRAALDSDLFASAYAAARGLASTAK